MTRQSLCIINKELEYIWIQYCYSLFQSWQTRSTVGLLTLVYEKRFQNCLPCMSQTGSNFKMRCGYKVLGKTIYCWNKKTLCIVHGQKGNCLKACCGLMSVFLKWKQIKGRMYTRWILEEPVQRGLIHQ